MSSESLPDFSPNSSTGRRDAIIFAVQRRVRSWAWEIILPLRTVSSPRFSFLENFRPEIEKLYRCLVENIAQRYVSGKYIPWILAAASLYKDVSIAILNSEDRVSIQRLPQAEIEKAFWTYYWELYPASIRIDQFYLFYHNKELLRDEKRGEFYYFEQYQEAKNPARRYVKPTGCRIQVSLIYELPDRRIVLR